MDLILIGNGHIKRALKRECNIHRHLRVLIVFLVLSHMWGNETTWVLYKVLVLDHGPVVGLGSWSSGRGPGPVVGLGSWSNGWGPDPVVGVLVQWLGSWSSGWGPGHLVVLGS